MVIAVGLDSTKKHFTNDSFWKVTEKVQKKQE